ncbi:early nodulin 75 precursor, putative [Talaromyces stipitatus ATCC 10500]|uniref:Early nodulin 75, putative n=1 Tax=Talaromyces stipitatus (strain ATCC 10500 / CBS 375.48 / QM 6759 / NRRL 1006) TaxID=441959 RepID=B8LZA2_TALSN|nr:early nodulin 75 precursor, putative [Talaromyces stipitatus ATCC 10500]EED21655.1 early nodulin 75 precursor, putative [Talaromyces stipitatus ATCC 10500]
MAAEEPQDSAGPSSPPPPLPEGWLAQWEGVSRKWYYVQRATGKSQWDIPTEPVILTPSTTPGSIGNGPTQAPRVGSQSLSPQTLAAESPDLSASRGLFSGNSTTRPGLSGVLGSGGNSAITQIADRVIGRIAKDFIPGKHGIQSSPGVSNNSSSHGSYGSGHNTLQNQAGQNSFGYASTGQSGTYTGSAPQYYPPGQTGPQPSDIPQHPPAGSSAYPSQYHAGNQPVQPNQFSSVNPGSQQPWPTQTSFSQNPHPAYQQPETYGHVNNLSGNIPPQPEWQAGAHPPVPHSTKPGGPLPQPGSNISSAITNSHPPPPSGNYQPPYHQQAPQHTTQQGPDPYGHGQYQYPYQQALHGNPSIGGPTQPGQQQQQQYASTYQQHPQVPSSQHSSPYHSNSGPISAPPPGIPNFQQQSNQLPHPNNLISPPNQYPPNNIPNNPPSHTPAFAVELPDNQINPKHQMMNMQNRPPNQHQYGQQQQVYPPQLDMPQKPHQPPAPNSAMGLDIRPSPTPMRHTPTDPSFVSGPWTSPPATIGHHYPPNRYNNPGGY